MKCRKILITYSGDRSDMFIVAQIVSICVVDDFELIRSWVLYTKKLYVQSRSTAKPPAAAVAQNIVLFIASSPFWAFTACEKKVLNLKQLSPKI